MRRLTYTKGFFFIEAKYLLFDVSGNKLLLMVNYKDGRFNLDLLVKKNSGVGFLEDEARKIATDLLKRKSRVNFAKNN